MDWKRIFLRSAGLGVGFALTLAVILGIVVWYDSRPKPPKPWDNRTIQAVFDRTIPEHAIGKVGLRYSLKNSGNEDFRIENKESIQISIRIGDDDELTPFNRVVSLETPVFIPAGRKSMVFLYLQTGETWTNFKHVLPAQATDEDEKEYEKAVLDYLGGTRITGFAVFDESHRMEIDFPAGWQGTGAKK